MKNDNYIGWIFSNLPLRADVEQPIVMFYIYMFKLVGTENNFVREAWNSKSAGKLGSIFCQLDNNVDEIESVVLV